MFGEHCWIKKHGQFRCIDFEWARVRFTRSGYQSESRLHDVISAQASCRVLRVNSASCPCLGRDMGMYVRLHIVVLVCHSVMSALHLATSHLHQSKRDSCHVVNSG